MSFWGRIFGLEKNPEYERGIKYFNEEKYDLAIEQLEKATDRINHDDPTYALGMFYAAEAHVHLGTAQFFSQNLDKALEHFEKAVKENPTYPDLYYRMGVIYHKKGLMEKAVSMLNKAVELNDRYFEAVCYLGIVYYESGEKEDADRYFARALELSENMSAPVSKFLSSHLSGTETDIPPLAAIKGRIDSGAGFKSLVKDGVEQFNTGHFQEAADTFEKLSRMHPGYPDIRFKLGLSYLRMGDHQRALDQFNEALRINPGYTEARFYLGILNFDMKRYAEALPHFERASSEKGDYADLKCYLGATLLYLGRYEESKEVFQEVLAMAPKYCQALYYYGLLLYLMGESGSAAEVLREGVKNSEKRGLGDVNLALIQLREGDLEGAMVTLKGIMEAGVESADVFYFVGDVFLRTGRIEEAEGFFRKALEINGDYLRAREKLAHILIKKERFEEAEEILSENKNRFADIYKIMGDIQYYRRNLDKAEELYRKSLEVNAEYSEVLLSLAIVLRNKGESEKAQEILGRLLDFEPDNIYARNLIGEGPLNISNI